MPQERRSKIIGCSHDIGSVQRRSQSSVKGRLPKFGTSLKKCSPSPVACAKHGKDECAEKVLQEVDELRRAGNLKCADDAYAEAKQLFSEALKLKPDAAQLLINHAFCLIMTGDPARADEDCCVAIALDRRLPSAYRWRATARRDCGWIVGALEDMRMAARMALTPDKHEAALQEVNRLKKWREGPLDAAKQEKAAEECRAREAQAETLAREARAAVDSILQQRQADLAQERAAEQNCRMQIFEEAELLLALQKKEKRKAKLLGELDDAMRRGENMQFDLQRGHVLSTKGTFTTFDDRRDLLEFFSKPKPPSSAAESSGAQSASQSASTSAKEPLSKNFPMSAQGETRSGIRTPWASGLSPRRSPVPAASESSRGPRRGSSLGPAAGSARPETARTPGDWAPVMDVVEDSDDEAASMEVEAIGIELAKLSALSVDSLLGSMQDVGDFRAAGIGADAQCRIFPQQKLTAARKDTAQAQSIIPAAAAAVSVHAATNVYDCETDSSASENEADERPPAARAATKAGRAALQEGDGESGKVARHGEGKGTGREAAAAESKAEAVSGSADQLPAPEEDQLSAEAQAGSRSSDDGPSENRSTQAAAHAAAAAAAGGDGTSGGASLSEGSRAPTLSGKGDAASESTGEAQQDKSKQSGTAHEAAAMAEEEVTPSETSSSAAAGSRTRKKKEKRKLKTAAAKAAAQEDQHNPGTLTEHSSTATQSSCLAESSQPTGRLGGKRYREDGRGIKSQPISAEDIVREANSEGGSGSSAAGSSASPAETLKADEFDEACIQEPHRGGSKVEATLQRAASVLEAHTEQESAREEAGAKHGGSLLDSMTNFVGSWLGMGKRGAPSQSGASSSGVSTVPETPSGGSTTPDSNELHITGLAGDCTAELPREEARRTFREAVEAEAYAEAHPMDAKAAKRWREAEEKFPLALKMCDRILVEDPGSGWALLTRAACFLHMREFKWGAEAYARALADARKFEGPAAHAHIERIQAAVEWEVGASAPSKEHVLSMLGSALKLSSSPQRKIQSLLNIAEAHLLFKDLKDGCGIVKHILSDPRLSDDFKAHISNCQRQRVSERLKAAGNDLQKNEALLDAKVLYSLSLDVDKNNVKALSNRALMNLKLGWFRKALEDCTGVINSTAADEALKDKALRRRAEAHWFLNQPEKAYADLHDLAHKTPEDRQVLDGMRLQLDRGYDYDPEASDEYRVEKQHSFKLVNRDSVPLEYRWVDDLPKQQPALDKLGNPMSGRSEPFLDDEAEDGCSLEEIQQRINNITNDIAAECAPEAGGSGAKSGNASPTRVASGLYSPSSEDCSISAAQPFFDASTSLNAPSTRRDSAADGVLGDGDGDGGVGSRCSSEASYCTAELDTPALSEYSEAPFGKCEESGEPDAAALPTADGSRRASSECGSAASRAQLSPFDSPSEISAAEDDGSDSDNKPATRRTSTLSFKQAPGFSSLEQDTDAAADGSQPDGNPGASKPGTLPNYPRGKPLAFQHPGVGPKRSVDTGSPANDSQHMATLAAAAAALAAPGPSCRRGGVSSRPQPRNTGSPPRGSAPQFGGPQRGFPKPPSPVGARQPEARPQPRRVSGLRGNFFENDGRGLYSDYEPVHKDPVRDKFSQEMAMRFFDQGMKAYKYGRLEEAKQALTHAVKMLHPDHDRLRLACTTLGKCCLDLHDTDGALLALTRATRLFELQARTHPAREHPMFVDSIDQAFACHHEVLRHVGRHKEAMETLTAALKLHKNCHICRELRALRHLQRGSPDVAVMDLEKLYTLLPSHMCQTEAIGEILAVTKSIAEENARKARMAARRAQAAGKKAGPAASREQPHQHSGDGAAQDKAPAAKAGPAASPAHQHQHSGDGACSCSVRHMLQHAIRTVGQKNRQMRAKEEARAARSTQWEPPSRGGGIGFR